MGGNCAFVAKPLHARTKRNLFWIFVDGFFGAAVTARPIFHPDPGAKVTSSVPAQKTNDFIERGCTYRAIINRNLDQVITSRYHVIFLVSRGRVDTCWTTGKSMERVTLTQKYFDGETSV